MRSVSPSLHRTQLEDTELFVVFVHSIACVAREMRAWI
jgi:hypothetical protein